MYVSAQECQCLKCEYLLNVIKQTNQANMVAEQAAALRHRPATQTEIFGCFLDSSANVLEYSVLR
jgi:hypothetical protein